MLLKADKEVLSNKGDLSPFGLWAISSLVDGLGTILNMRQKISGNRISSPLLLNRLLQKGILE